MLESRSYGTLKCRYLEGSHTSALHLVPASCPQSASHDLSLIFFFSLQGPTFCWFSCGVRRKLVIAKATTSHQREAGKAADFDRENLTLSGMADFLVKDVDWNVTQMLERLAGLQILLP